MHERHPRRGRGAAAGRDAVLSATGTTAPTQRDRHIQAIAEKGWMACQRDSGYNQRARVEGQFGRWKPSSMQHADARGETTRRTLSNGGLKLRHGLEEVGDEAVVGDLEDRRLLVLVDRDDDLGVLHAGQVLDRAGDADGDVQLGRHDLAGLADLPVVRRVAGVDRRAAGAERGAELVGQRLDQLELLARAQPRPPETMILAPVSSGRSFLAIRCRRRSAIAGVGTAGARSRPRPCRRSPRRHRSPWCAR